MSVTIKSKSDIQKLREAGRIAANALVHAGKVIHPGMTTKQLDKSIHDFIVGCGAVPTFLGYGGFPASACISINDEIIHGIPSHKRVIREGDIVSVDVGATFNGFVGDTAYTFAVGDISEEAADLLRVTEASLYAAIDAAKSGHASAMCPIPWKNIAVPVGTVLYGNTADTGSAVRCTRIRRCRTMASPATACG